MPSPGSPALSQYRKRTSWTSVCRELTQDVGLGHDCLQTRGRSQVSPLYRPGRGPERLPGSRRRILSSEFQVRSFTFEAGGRGPPRNGNLEHETAQEEGRMSAGTEQVISGLEGVLAGESSVTFLDGLADPSVLEYRGYNIHDIAETTSFEEVAYLVLEGKPAEQGRACQLRPGAEGSPRAAAPGDPDDRDAAEGDPPDGRLPNHRVDARPATIRSRRTTATRRTAPRPCG